MALLRDIFGSLFVIICAGIVHRWGLEYPEVKYVDPLFTIFTVIVLVLASIKIGKEACHCLLLTIPDHIQISSITKQLLQSVPEIINIHDFHVWQLTPNRIIASAHIVLEQTSGYLAIQNSIVDFLQQHGIESITLQPEFLTLNTPDASPSNPRRRKCFLPCEEDCEEKQCCATSDFTPRNSLVTTSFSVPIASTFSGPSSGDLKLSKPNTSTTEDGGISDDNEAAELEPMINTNA